MAQADWAVTMAYGRIIFDNGNPGGNWDRPLFGNRPINDGHWHAVAIVRNGATGGSAIWIDGEPDASAVYNTFDLSNDLPLTIGDENGSVGPIDHAFRGDLDEIRLWDIVRSAAEIQSDSWRSLRGDEPGLVAYWSMNEGRGQVVHDRSPNHNHGQLGSMRSADPNDPSWTVAAPAPEQ